MLAFLGDIQLQGSWTGQAACRFYPAELFFEGEPGSAKAICASCDVKSECLEFAIRSGDSGVWGGTTGRERQRMRRRSPIRG